MLIDNNDESVTRFLLRYEVTDSRIASASLKDIGCSIGMLLFVRFDCCCCDAREVKNDF